MPDRAADALVHGAHGRVEVESRGGGFRIRRAPTFLRRRGSGALDMRQLRPPLRALIVRKGQPHDHDAPPQRIAEIDAFGEGAADDGEEEGAAAVAGGDGVRVRVEELVDGGGFAFGEDGFAKREGVVDAFLVRGGGGRGGELPAGDDLGEVGVAGEENDEAVRDFMGEGEEGVAELVDHAGVCAGGEGEVEGEGGGAGGQGEGEEVGGGDDVPAGEGKDAGGREVGEEVLSVVFHLCGELVSEWGFGGGLGGTGDMVPPARITARASSTISRKLLVGSRSMYLREMSVSVLV